MRSHKSGFNCTCVETNKEQFEQYIVDNCSIEHYLMALTIHSY